MPADAFDGMSDVTSSLHGLCVLHSLAMLHRRGVSVVQADIFSFGVLMYEVLCGCITSQLVVGPTGNIRAAEVYAAKASRRQLHIANELSLCTLCSCTTTRPPCCLTVGKMTPILAVGQVRRASVQEQSIRNG